ncbi:MAG TPA: trypsin-like peptidase domain-containing protein [Acidimicrobiales bacterium]|nr:trypsin-like peptidase domain-containing protein [Acidimicrobiales bacterium]
MVSVQSQTEPNEPATPGGGDGPRAGARADRSDPGLGRRQWVAVASLAAIIGAIAGAGVGAIVATGIAGHNNTTIVHEALPPQARLSQVNDVPAVLAAVEPAVASITTDQGVGTGMVISAAGDIITNYHVVAGANYIHVSLYHRSGYLGAFVTGYDQDSDVALLHVPDVSDLATVVLGDSSQLKVGDNVIAVGNALNLPGGPSATTGIVSALGRTIGGTTFTAGELVPPNLIQTDAAINPGNSGGPLLDAAGDVIGMSTLVIQQANDTESAQGLGFAIPINTIKSLIPTLRRGSKVAPTELGISMQDNTPQLAAQYGFRISTGVVVSQVLVDSPAYRAGMDAYDVIVSFAGQQVHSSADLITLLAQHSAGQKVTLTAMRGSTAVRFTLTLE